MLCLKEVQQVNSQFLLFVFQEDFEDFQILKNFQVKQFFLMNFHLEAKRHFELQFFPECLVLLFLSAFFPVDLLQLYFGFPEEALLFEDFRLLPDFFSYFGGTISLYIGQRICSFDEDFSSSTITSR